VKKHLPDTGAALGALAARLDALDHLAATVDTHTGDITALARAVADLTAQARTQAQAATTRAIRNAGTNHTGTDPDTGAGTDAGPATGTGQPDWVTVTDPALAAGWLTGAHAFITGVLAPIGAAPPAACWPLHPDVVTEVLALQAQHHHAYTTDPTAVSEYLSRWLPGAVARITDALAACTADRGHRHGGATYHVPVLDPARVATWWTDTTSDPQTTPHAIEAFAMTPQT
jgi:hypothetical protein